MAVAAAGDAFYAEGADGGADPFFDGVEGFEHDVAEGFFFCVAHADFVPIVGGVAAGGVRLTEGLHADAGFFAEVRELFAGEHAFYLDVVGLLEV